jgi:hypothetical protein
MYVEGFSQPQKDRNRERLRQQNHSQVGTTVLDLSLQKKSKFP